MTPTKMAIVAAIVAIILVYISYYYRYPRDVSILQTSLPLFKESLLLEKQPIVIADRLGDIQQLRDAWFGYNIVRTVELPASEEGWYRNRFKYLVIQPTSDSEILLYPAGKIMIDGEPNPEETLLAIKAAAQQVVIVPIHWHVLMPTKTAPNAFGVHDLLSVLLP